MNPAFMSPLLGTLLPPLAGAVICGLAGGRLGEKNSGRIASAAVLASFLGACVSLTRLLALPPEGRLLREVFFSWLSAGSFSVDFALRSDPLSSVMALVVTGVGALIHLYSIGYMRGDPGVGRYFSYLNLFVFFMLTLVLADNPVLMFVGWEGVGLCSYLLIGFWHGEEKNAAAGKKAFITNRVGDAGFLAGLMLFFTLLRAAGEPEMDFSSLAANTILLKDHLVLGLTAPTLIGLLLFFGAVGKSAQFPLHVWLPDAMAGPTPVSALMHAATMVTAGVYMLVRMDFLYALAPLARETVIYTGAFTALLGAAVAVYQNDIKKTLAWSTISQIGYMIMAAGAGAGAAAVFHLTAHAFFKALLFLGAGAVIHGLEGEQDMSKMGGLARELPYTFAAVLIGWLAITGIPPFAGFFSKDLVLRGVRDYGATAAWYAGLAAAGLTGYYVTRLVKLTFLGGRRGEGRVHPAPFIMLAPMAALALLAAAGGALGRLYLLPFLSPGTLAGGAFSLRGAAAPVGTALAGILAGFLLAGRPYAAVPLYGGLRRLAANRFYFDELYAFAITRPLRRTAGGFVSKLIEGGLIDGLMVRGSARFAYGAGAALRRMQSGNGQAYVLYFAAGAVLLLYWAL